MANAQDPKRKKTTSATKSKKHDWSYYVIIVSSILIAIPVLFFGYHIVHATFQTGKPIFGDRFRGDLTTKIDDTMRSQMRDKIKTDSRVENVEVSLIAATLRVNIKTAQATPKDGFEAIADGAYAMITQIAPVSPYFTKTDTAKMYDLEINVYNTDKPTAENPFTYLSVNKSSATQTLHKEFASDTRSPEFIEKLIKSQTKPDESNKDKDVATGS